MFGFSVTWSEIAEISAAICTPLFVLSALITTFVDEPPPLQKSDPFPRKVLFFFYKTMEAVRAIGIQSKQRPDVAQLIKSIARKADDDQLSRSEMMELLEKVADIAVQTRRDKSLDVYINPNASPGISPEAAQQSEAAGLSYDRSDRYS